MILLAQRCSFAHGENNEKGGKAVQVELQAAKQKRAGEAVDAGEAKRLAMWQHLVDRPTRAEGAAIAAHALNEANAAAGVDIQGTQLQAQVKRGVSFDGDAQTAKKQTIARKQLFEQVATPIGRRRLLNRILAKQCY